MARMSHPRRVALGYRVRSWAAYAGAAVALAGGAVLGVGAASPPLAAAGAVVALALLIAGRVMAGRSRRYAVGAASESRVADALRALDGGGWSIRHSVPWPGRGDVDHVVHAPNGITFAVETKTSRYGPEHLRQARDAAAFAAGRRGTGVPVICLARPRGVERADGGVEIVSADRLVRRLRRLAGER